MHCTYIVCSSWMCRLCAGNSIIYVSFLCIIDTVCMHFLCIEYVYIRWMSMQHLCIVFLCNQCWNNSHDVVDFLCPIDAHIFLWNITTPSISYMFLYSVYIYIYIYIKGRWGGEIPWKYIILIIGEQTWNTFSSNLFNLYTYIYSHRYTSSN